MPLILLILFSLFITASPIYAQDIGILSGGEPTPAKPKKTPPVKRPTPPRKQPDKDPVKTPPTKAKALVNITINSEPTECEIYLNDIYRGTTAASNGKLIIADLDPTVTYTLRVYKRGVGENVQVITPNEETGVTISLSQLAKNNDATNTKPVKDPIKDPVKDPIKDPVKDAIKDPIKDPKTTDVAINKPENKTPDVKPTPAPPVKPNSPMVLVPGGDFTIGSNKSYDNEKPQRKTNLAGFYIDVYEVTNGEYKLFCDATSRPYPAAPAWDKDYFLTKPNYPVINVSWEDATAYAQWVGKRLPTEEEWEKAARGSENRIWPWGKDFQISFANLQGNEDGYDYAAPIGSFKGGISTFGAYDMAGNVWEWTSSQFKPYPGGPEKDALYKQDCRVIRGGGFQAPPTILKGMTFRFPSDPKMAYEATGFRCARSQ